jgi:hypothetical protein
LSGVGDKLVPQAHAYPKKIIPVITDGCPDAAAVRA